MSIAALRAIGLADFGTITPVSGVRRVAGRGPILVRPVGAGESQSVASAPGKRESLSRTARDPVRGTAYQTNADGDSATFESRLGSLTRQEQAQLEKLRLRDQEVRTHEAAHKAAAGGLASGGPAYETHTGPDGRDYAVGGHVKIDTSPGQTPEETISKARRVRQAALAPADPSGQDLAVASKAARMEAQARVEIAKRRAGESGITRGSGYSVATTGSADARGTLDVVA